MMEINGELPCYLIFVTDKIRHHRLSGQFLGAYHELAHAQKNIECEVVRENAIGFIAELTPGGDLKRCQIYEYILFVGWQWRQGDGE